MEPGIESAWSKGRHRHGATTNCTVENMVVQGEICMVAQPHDTQRWCHNALAFHRDRSYKHKLGFSEIRTVGDGVVQGRFP